MLSSVLCQSEDPDDMSIMRDYFSAYAICLKKLISAFVIRLLESILSNLIHT